MAEAPTRALERAKEVLKNGIDSVRQYLEKVQANIEGSEQVDSDRAAALGADVQALLDRLDALEAKVDAGSEEPDEG